MGKFRTLVQNRNRYEDHPAFYIEPPQAHKISDGRIIILGGTNRGENGEYIALMEYT